MQLSKKILILVSIAYVACTLTSLPFIYHHEKTEAIEEAHSVANTYVARNIAFHKFFAEEMRPRLFAQFNDQLSDGYFDPTWMSSGYILSQLNELYRNEVGGKFSAKTGALDPRSLRGALDPFESEIFIQMRQRPDFEEWTGVRKIDGERFFTHIRRGVDTDEKCFRCHGDPKDAPKQLIELYGDKRSFGWKPGVLAAIEVINVPIEEALSGVASHSLKLSILTAALLFILSWIFWIISRNLLLNPVRQLTKTVSKIADDPHQIGEEVEPFGAWEFDDLARAFNMMSGRLKIYQDELESRVWERTVDLEESMKQLDYSNRIYRRAFVDSPHPILLIDAEENVGKILAVNEQACEIHQMSHGSMISMTIFDLNVESQRENARDRLLKATISDRIQFETEHLTGSGRTVHLDVVAAGVEIDGKKRVLAIETDISDRKEKERKLMRALRDVEEANLTKTRFLANMSHEIRTPLNGIMGMLDLIDQELTDASCRDYVMMSRQAADSLLRLINEILDLSRVESGNMTFNSSPISIDNILSSVSNLFAPECKKKGIELKVIGSESNPTLIGDEMRIRQILLNLVGNAVKFTERGSVTLLAELYEAEFDMERFIRFTVSDTGPGIPLEKRDHLFEPFTQIDSSYQKHHQGAGLGLSIVKHLAELMGGKVEVTSELGNGATFVVEIRLQCSSFELPKVEESCPQITTPEITDLHILVAEDNLVNARLVSRLLEKMGHRVVLVENGTQAVQSVTEQEFDLVLMDIQMPVMDGLEATKLIRSGRNPDIDNRIPIIALTAYAMNGDEENFIAAGMDAYISKPVKVKTLKEIIVRAIDKRQTAVH